MRMEAANWRRKSLYKPSQVSIGCCFIAVLSVLCFDGLWLTGTVMYRVLITVCPLFQASCRQRTGETRRRWTSYFAGSMQTAMAPSIGTSDDDKLTHFGVPYFNHPVFPTGDVPVCAVGQLDTGHVRDEVLVPQRFRHSVGNRRLEVDRGLQLPDAG